MRKTKATDSSDDATQFPTGDTVMLTNPSVDAPSRRRLPPLLRRAWYSLNQAFRRRIAYSGLTPDQFTILRLLTEAPAEGLTQREMAVLMSSDPNTIASLLDRMQEAKLLERRPHEKDRRAHRVRLLPKGRSVYLELRNVALDLQAGILASLPEERREQFLEDLEKVADACQTSAKPPPQPPA
jgi:DNA-binding MarR family transcriptional regulator